MLTTRLAQWFVTSLAIELRNAMVAEYLRADAAQVQRHTDRADRIRRVLRRRYGITIGLV